MVLPMSTPGTIVWLWFHFKAEIATRHEWLEQLDCRRDKVIQLFANFYHFTKIIGNKLRQIRWFFPNNGEDCNFCKFYPDYEIIYMEYV